MRYSNRVGIIFTSVLLALGVVAHGALSGGGGGAAPTPPYDASSPWNTAVSGTPTVDPNSATFMSAISDNLRPLTDDPSQFTPSVEAWDNAHVPSSHQISFTGCAGKHADWINT